MKRGGNRGGYNTKGELKEVTSEKKQNNEDNKTNLKNQKQKFLHTKKKAVNENIKKILLFPGEEYDFNEKLIHYDAFGFSNGNLISKRCGVILCDNETGKALDDKDEEVYRSIGKYYSPKVDDFVLGTIVQKSSEFYRIDINSYTTAILNTKDFEGATKKQKPNLNLGDLVFARVLKTNKFDAPVLSCVSLHEHKNWASGESYFGNLKGGNAFTFNKIHTWEFYNENNTLSRLNDCVGYEIIIGFNGRLWINSDTPENIFNIYEILMASLIQSKEEIEKMIHNTFIDKLKK